MEALLFLGFVAIISVEAAVGKYAGDKVLRLRPENEQHLQFIRHVSHSAEVDFWQPHSVELVTTNRSVDFRIGAGWASEVQAGLNKIGLKYDILIENVQNLMEKQFDRNKTDSTGYDYEKYHRWDEIESWIAKITIENPKLVSRFKIGHSYERRSIYLLRVGKRTGFMKPAIFLDCGIHAREWISPAFCQWFVKEAVRNYGSDPAMTTLLNKLDFLVVPVINVDGYVYSWARDRFWRKTRSRNPGSRCVGTDPNRNFDAKWCSIGASRDPCDDIYCGSHAESEKEVKAVAGFIRQYCCIKAYLTIHSYSQMCLFPYSYTYSLTPNYKELILLLVVQMTGPMIWVLSILSLLNCETLALMASCCLSPKSGQPAKKPCWQSTTSPPTFSTIHINPLDVKKVFVGYQKMAALSCVLDIDLQFLETPGQPWEPGNPVLSEGRNRNSQVFSNQLNAMRPVTV
ncbi:carboxypeptidase B-like isoform X1 [Carcharodon carcharias]|uniref:carboxypeptidase B-like isoform X1 n=1 Tax=Carcharodon carcharias TaxID=13397 RepID=UPI001B7F173E|nr:carboxypeptidase B-like isoform X1 [Carcharodon carcharias]